VIIDIDLAARTGAIRFLLHVLGEGPIEIAPILAAVFLHLIDSPKKRAYIRVGTDLEVSILRWSILRFLTWMLIRWLCLPSRTHMVKEGIT